MSPSSTAYVNLPLFLLLNTQIHKSESLCSEQYSHKTFISSLACSLQALQEVTIKNHKGIKEAIHTSQFLPYPETMTLHCTPSSQSRRARSHSQIKSPGDSSHLDPHSAQVPPFPRSLPHPSSSSGWQSIPFLSALPHHSTCHGVWSSRLTCLFLLDCRHLASRGHVLVTFVLGDGSSKVFGTWPGVVSRLC